MQQPIRETRVQKRIREREENFVAQRIGLSDLHVAEQLRLIRLHSGPRKRPAKDAENVFNDAGSRLAQCIDDLGLTDPAEAMDDLNDEFSEDDDDDHGWGLNPLLPKPELWGLSMKLASSNLERMMIEEQVAKDQGLALSYRRAALVAESTLDHDRATLDYTDRPLVTPDSLVISVGGLCHPAIQGLGRAETELWEALAGYEEVSCMDVWDSETFDTSREGLIRRLMAELRDQEADAHITKMQAYLKTRLLQ